MFGSRKTNSDHGDELRVTERKVVELEARADRVIPALTARRKRNHWGETIAAIARREHPA